MQIKPQSKCSPPPPTGLFSEDCLFLDVYVPKSAFDSGAANTPVVVWFFGGAYIFGSKNAFGPNMPFYSGDGILESASKIPKDVIFVAGNYRVGAFGWLAGPTMKKDGLPNAGLYDQRLVLQWVQDFISLFGGDKSQVSAWGESAGAGSIVHHLVQVNGTRDPLFSKALLQSPAFQWQWDRSENGTLERIYENFKSLANCASGEMDCLRNADTQTLQRANQGIYDQSAITGLFPVGPAIDDIWLSYLPAVAFEKGKFGYKKPSARLIRVTDHYWKEISSMIVSHVFNESEGFVPPWINTRADFTQYLKDWILEPNLKNVREAIEVQYPPSGPPYNGDQRKRASDVIRDSTFTCNTRQLFDAYRNTTSTYMMQYSFGADFNAAKHTSDLLPTFWNERFDYTQFLEKYQCLGWFKAFNMAKGVKRLAPKYQQYFANHAIFGNPSPKGQIHPAWNVATLSADGENVQNVMDIKSDPVLIPEYNDAFTDIINTKSICDFWMAAAFNVSQQIRKQRLHLDRGIVPTQESLFRVQDYERWEL